MTASIGSFFVNEKTTLDQECLDTIDANLQMMVPWYLMAAYAYYEEDNPILSDSMFDKLAKKMLEHWDEITHQHKGCITKEDLTAGSFLGKYPSRVQGGLKSLREVYYGKNSERTNPRSTRRSKNP
jgi:hypothetical protein